MAPTVTTSYWARLTDPNNGCYGDTGTVTINVCVPTITTQPQPVTVNPNTPVTLTVIANGNQRWNVPVRFADGKAEIVQEYVW